MGTVGLWYIINSSLSQGTKHFEFIEKHKYNDPVWGCVRVSGGLRSRKQEETRCLSSYAYTVNEKKPQLYFIFTVTKSGTRIEKIIIMFY